MKPWIAFPSVGVCRRGGHPRRLGAAGLPRSSSNRHPPQAYPVNALKISEHWNGVNDDESITHPSRLSTLRANSVLAVLIRAWLLATIVDSSSLHSLLCWLMLTYGLSAVERANRTPAILVDPRRTSRGKPGKMRNDSDPVRCESPGNPMLRQARLHADQRTLGLMYLARFFGSECCR